MSHLFWLKHVHLKHIQHLFPKPRNDMHVSTELHGQSLKLILVSQLGGNKRIKPIEARTERTNIQLRRSGTVCWSLEQAWVSRSSSQVLFQI